MDQFITEAEAAGRLRTIPEGNDWVSQPPPKSPSAASALKQAGRELRQDHPLTDEGVLADSLTLQLGPETFSLVKYNSFTVGPVTVTVKAGQGETGVQLYEKAKRLLNQLFVLEYEDALTRYLEHIRTGAERAMQRGG